MSVSRRLAVAGLCAWIGAWATEVAAAPYPEPGGLDGFEDATSAARRAMVHPIVQHCHDASAVGTCPDAAIDPNGRVGSNVRQEVGQESVAPGAGLAGTDAGDRAPYRLAGPLPASSVHVGGVLSKIRQPEPGTPLLLGLVLFAAAYSVPRLRARG